MDIESGINLYAPKFRCKRHGIVEGSLHVSLTGQEADYCLRCFAEWVDEYVTKLEPVKEAT